VYHGNWAQCSCKGLLWGGGDILPGFAPLPAATGPALPLLAGLWAPDNRMLGKLRRGLCCRAGAALRVAWPRLLRGGCRLLGRGDTRPLSSRAGALDLGCRLLGPAPGDTRPDFAGEIVGGRWVAEVLGPCGSGEREEGCRCL
jgi:hypothetical protein